MSKTYKQFCYYVMTTPYIHQYQELIDIIAHVSEHVRLTLSTYMFGCMVARIKLQSILIITCVFTCTPNLEHKHVWTHPGTHTITVPISILFSSPFQDAYLRAPLNHHPTHSIKLRSVCHITNHRDIIYLSAATWPSADCVCCSVCAWCCSL